MNAKCVKLDGAEKFTRLLSGTPETSGMKSGYVTLSAGESVGEHVTVNREESIIILEGMAEVYIAGARAFVAGAHYLIYIPPGTVHDIRNSGAEPLRYVYVVTPACNASGSGAHTA